MGVKGKKSNKPKTADGGKQNHAFDEISDVLESLQKLQESKKKQKKKPQKEAESVEIKTATVEGKKSKKRKQSEGDPAPDNAESPKKKKKQTHLATTEAASPVKKPKKKKNKSNPDTEAEVNSNPDTVGEESSGSPKKPKKKKKSNPDVVENDLAKVEPSESPKKKKKKDDPTDDPPASDTEQEPKKLAYNHADEKKTVFCGNIPNETGVNQTTIKNLFAQYGKIKTIRMRADNGGVLFSKKNKKSCKSFNAYVVFETIEEAKKSIQLNGYKLKESHLRVNMANDKNKAFQSKGTIFVGNLPFDSTEKEIHDLFSSCGKINYVRIIPRKGICYVCFDKGGTSIINALKMHDTEFKERKIRVTRCETKEKQEKKKLYKRDPKTGRKIKLRVKKSHKLNDEVVRGRGSKSINNPIIKKIKDSQKAKFNRFTDNEQHTSKKELFRRGGKFDKDNREMNRNKMKQKRAFFGSKVDDSDMTGKKKGVKKGKINKTAKEHKVIAKKLKSAAMRSLT